MRATNTVKLLLELLAESTSTSMQPPKPAEPKTEIAAKPAGCCCV